MAKKPFRVTDPNSTSIVRMPDGRFANAETPTPPEIFEKAETQDKTLSEVVSENRSSTAQQRIPWPPADKVRPPMKLGS